MGRPIKFKATVVARMNAFFLCHFFHFLYRPRMRRAKPQGEKVQTPHSADPSSFQPPQASTLPSKAVQHESRTYYDLAQRLRQLLPPNCNWLGSNDIRIIDTTAFSSGGFSEVWHGSLQGLAVAVKSLRCYSTPEFDPAEVGIVSHNQSGRSRRC